ncbi:MAG TPA: amidohydrolase family protein [Vicinamibacterales bacterium]|nr:amidohydrolase family protein [Vicinamibacterales bacterium]
MSAGWDCHAHVIGDPDRFPFWPGRSYTPATATLESYLAMLDRFGLARGVLIQPSVYGFDHRCLLDALDRADGRLLGIAVPAPDIAIRDLESMHRRGIRGVRCNLINPGGLAPGVVAAWQPTMRELGWHVELQIGIAGVESLAAFVGQFDVPVVIDHLGRPPAGTIDPASGPAHELVELVRRSACFVKISAPYRSSAGPAPWSDVSPLARALIAANPRRCLWGSDWPHVDTAAPVRTADVVAAFSNWCGEPALEAQVLGQTPLDLFGSSPESGRGGAARSLQ